MTRNQEIAETILKQLGGHARLTAMIGARNFTAGESALGFHINCKKFNSITITLDTNDTYSVRFVKFSGYTIRDEKTVSDIYVEQLKEVIEHETGLYLSL
jgi:hypothetical protein